MPPRVELLWFEECPSWERALADLREAMAEAGLDPGGVVLRRVETQEEAERVGFLGSPTIRVNGADVEAPAERGPAGLACRVYRRPDGRVSPLPDPEDVRAALDRATGRPG